MRKKDRKTSAVDRTALLAIASIIAIGGLIYELILGTASSYLFGDSVVSFSVGIGFSLFGMGLGSMAAFKLVGQAEKRFLQNELILSLLGGYSVVILFAAFSYTELYWLVFIVLSTSIGVCIGLEIPLVVASYRKLGNRKSEKFLSSILAVDYLGALIGSLLFPFILLPYLGIVRAGLMVGLLNLSVVLFLVWRRRKVAVSRIFKFSTIGALVLLMGGFVAATRIENALTSANYIDPVVYYDLSPYQRIVLTKYKQDTRLYLNGNLQFSTVDEARYHETLAHAALSSAPDISRVLVLGGGDGLLVREVLEYPEVQDITLVDLDPAITDMARSNPIVRDINQDSLHDERVSVVNSDAFNYVRDQDAEAYDVVLVDLVDPANDKIAKLYSVDFYREIARVVSSRGVLITQASSTFYTPRAFWSIHASMSEVFPAVLPMSVNVPSFGEWGFMLAAKDPGMQPFEARSFPADTSYLTEDTLQQALILDKATLAEKHAQKSTILRPAIHHLYNKDLSDDSF